jgi:hypothetical protein
MEFQSLCKSLSHILSPAVTLWPELTEWVRVLHEMAEDCPTALLWSPRTIWKFEWEMLPRHYVGDVTGAVIDGPLYAWAPVRPPCAPYPKHPLRRALAFNLFSSSVAAIEIILAPENAIFFDDVQPEDLPVILAGEQLPSTDESEVKIEPDEQTLLLHNDKDFFPFLFRKVGGGWIIRFWTGEKMEMALIPEPQKGCSHYQKLLTSPGKPVSSLEVDPPKKTDLPETYVPSGSSISEDEYKQGASDVEWDKARRKFYAPVYDDELKMMAEDRESLKSQIAAESDKAEQKKLKNILKYATKSFNEHFRSVQQQSASNRAFNRVKGAMLKAREAMKGTEKLPAFLDHLQESFQEVGQGHLYAPKRLITWET